MSIEIPYPVLIIQVLDCPENEGWDDEDKDAHRHFVYYAPRKPVCELAVEKAE